MLYMLLSQVLMVISFVIGFKIGKGEKIEIKGIKIPKIEIPSISDIADNLEEKKIHREEIKEQKKEIRILKAIDHNVDIYDGTPKGQIDISKIV